MTNAYQNIKFSIDDRVARITFDRPPLNIFNIAMMREIGQALDDCVSHRDLAAVVFAAAPGTNAFSAGVAAGEKVGVNRYPRSGFFFHNVSPIGETAQPPSAVLQ